MKRLGDALARPVFPAAAFFLSLSASCADNSDDTGQHAEEPCQHEPIAFPISIVRSGLGRQKTPGVAPLFLRSCFKTGLSAGARVPARARLETDP